MWRWMAEDTFHRPESRVPGALDGADDLVDTDPTARYGCHTSMWAGDTPARFHDDTENDELLACSHCLAREMRWMLSESLGEDTDAICVSLGIKIVFVNQRVILAAANQQLGI
jgi:hypothetical protein